MVDISGNNLISFTHGDDIEFDLHIFINDRILGRIEYFPEGDDQVLLSIMEPNQPFERGIIRKVFLPEVPDSSEPQNIVIRLSSSDTANVLPGQYYYEVKLIRAISSEEELIDTVVSSRKLNIL